MLSEPTPSWISSILRWPRLWQAARIALVSAYVLGGVTKLFDFAGTVAEQKHFGLNPGWLWASAAIAVELGGSFLVVANKFLWLGAGGLGVLTFIAMVTANAFWDMGGHERFVAANSFFEHLGLIAGLIVVSMFSERTSQSAIPVARSAAIQGVSQ